MNRDVPFIDTVEKLQEEIDRVKKAQALYATYTQEQVDRIFLAAATAANKARIPLAKAAVAETGMLLRESAYSGSSSWANALALARSCPGVTGDPYKEEFIYLLTLLERQQ